MKIGIVGTRGIPNMYGGFEQFAEHFSARMATRGHEVVVYTSHKHPYQLNSYNNVSLVHCYDAEHRIGTFGQFIYDFNCILDSRKQKFDIIMQLGYTSSSIWSWLFPQKPVLVTNMDGLEWKRSKYGRLTKRFLRTAERWAVQHSDYLIADSRGIQDYLMSRYETASEYVAYGADVFAKSSDDLKILAGLELKPGQYDLLIARMEPENNIEIVLNAYAGSKHKLVVVGSYKQTTHGMQLYTEYSKLPNISFRGGIFDSNKLNVLRAYSRLYFHGHSVGGTNPSLLEAMGCEALICAHDNVFNRHILGDDAFYFDSAASVKNILDSDIEKQAYRNLLQNNVMKIQRHFNWEIITDTLENLFKQWTA